MSIIHNYCITGKNFQFLNNLSMNIIISGSELKDLTGFPIDWNRDNNGINISSKNKNYGTLTSHYWLWKNEINNYADDDWIGINHYRRFWIKKNTEKNIEISNLPQNILREVPPGDDFDVLLPEKVIMENLKLSKLIKKGFQNYVRKPSLLFNRKRISIELHFDLFHGYRYLSEAAKLLDDTDRVDFENYIKEQNSFHGFGMFVSKKKIIDDLFERLYKWIFKCEKRFSKEKLTGYGKERLYDFFAERYYSFYFEKYTKINVWPWIMLHKDMV